MIAVGQQQRTRAVHRISDVLWRVTDGIIRRTNLIRAVSHLAEATLTRTGHRRARRRRAHNHLQRAQRNLSANATQFNTRIHADAVLAAPVRNHQRTQQALRRQRVRTRANLARNIARDHRALREPCHNELRRWALLRHKRNLAVRARRTLSAGLVVAHLVAALRRLNVPELRRVRHREHAHLVNRVALLQRLRNRQHEAVRVRLRGEGVVVN